MKISVVIPVYNAEATISRCIDSIMKQTFSEWEIIAVDDGSSDNSLEILNEISIKDNRVRVFHQKNMGAGAARNTGLLHVSGDYIVFVDADDVIEKTYFELLSVKDADVVYIDVNRIDSITNKATTEKMSRYRYLSTDEFLRSQMTGKILWGGVRKAVRFDLIKNNNIHFSSHTVGEEAIYSFCVMYFANSIDFIDIPVYCYYQYTNSLSRTKLDDPWGTVEKNLRQEIISMGEYDKYANTLNSFALTALIVSLDHMASIYKCKQYLNKANERIKQFLNEVDSNYEFDIVSIDNRVKFLLLSNTYRLPFFMYCISHIRRIIRK